MKKIVNNQRGITLVEILAAVVIIGFLSILILNIQAESSDQYKINYLRINNLMKFHMY